MPSRAPIVLHLSPSSVTIEDTEDVRFCSQRNAFQWEEKLGSKMLKCKIELNCQLHPN